MCPKLLPTVLQDRTPLGEIDKTVFLTRIKEITSLNGCVEQCCRNETCKIVFAYRNSQEFDCFLVISSHRMSNSMLMDPHLVSYLQGTCTEDDKCLPVVPQSPTLEKLKGKALMVMVRTSGTSNDLQQLQSDFDGICFVVTEITQMKK